MQAKKRRNKDRQLLNEHWKRKQRLKRPIDTGSVEVTSCQVFRLEDEKLEPNWMGGKKAKHMQALLCVLAAFGLISSTSLAQVTSMHSDPRPTIYSGQVSFGLLLSAHSSLGAELSSSASHQVKTILAADGELLTSPSTPTKLTWTNTSATIRPPEVPGALGSESHRRRVRQLFHSRRHQQTEPAGSSGTSPAPVCNQINPNALFAGMGAIWASHQANLVGDSQLAIGTYVYDSCNDLDVGQRQSVRIVSNLNAFQQTTCESPRGSPISLTIAHGDHQLRAIQLLTSFKVPVIATKENFAMEDYGQLSRDQRRFLFATAPSSRHLAMGALRFSKRIVKRSSQSAKLPNQFHQMSSKNGLIVISRNLPARFISFLSEMIPNQVNYEILQSSQPIDQIGSVSALESILIKSSSASESRLSETRAELEPAESELLETTAPVSRLDDILRGPDEGHERDPKQRRRRQSEDSDSASDLDNSKMLSPTILMFITPAEAIDLITRLRNDLAEVSKYFSLIVATREDISPALKTIFHRGGSRLCSGKAFYTISPRPDEIAEFTRYFRDTVQMEGESSDHPLICEFSKYQATSKISADLDEISAEPVIKAVWAASAAFKAVHRRECGSTLSTSTPPVGNVYRAGSTSSTPPSGSTSSTESSSGDRQTKSQRHSAGPGGSGKSSHSECLIRMNKNLSNLVQRALKRLDVSVNSTGLQAFDGFRLRFDDMNELMTNKFSIKYINKECEMVELGQYSGLKDSTLRIDEDLLNKSLEATLPDPWPPAPTPPPTMSSPGVGVTGTGTSQGSSSSSSPATTSSSDSTSSLSDSSPSSPMSKETSNDAGAGSSSSSSDSTDDPRQASEEEEPTEAPEKTAPRGTAASNEAPLRTSRRGSRTSTREQWLVSDELLPKTKLKRPNSVTLTALSGRNTSPGLTDETTENASSGHTNAPTKPMRTIRPYPTETTSLSEWQLAKLVEQSSRKPSSTKAADNEEQTETTEASAGRGAKLDLKARATTQPPVVYTTLPESGGNADLELPPSRAQVTRIAKSASNPPRSARLAQHLANTDPTAAATESSLEYATLPTISKHQAIHLLSMNPNGLQNGLSINNTPRVIHQVDVESARLNYLRDIDSTPMPILKSSSNLEAKANRLKLR